MLASTLNAEVKLVLTSRWRNLATTTAKHGANPSLLDLGEHHSRKESVSCAQIAVCFVQHPGGLNESSHPGWVSWLSSILIAVYHTSGSVPFII